MGMLCLIRGMANQMGEIYSTFTVCGTALGGWEYVQSVSSGLKVLGSKNP